MRLDNRHLSFLLFLCGCVEAGLPPPAPAQGDPATLTLRVATITQLEGTFIRGDTTLEFFAERRGETLRVLLLDGAGHELVRLDGDAEGTDIALLGDALEMHAPNVEAQVTRSMVGVDAESPGTVAAADPNCMLANVARCPGTGQNGLSCSNGYTCCWNGSQASDCQNAQGACEIAQQKPGEGAPPDEVFGRFLASPEAQALPWLSMALGLHGINGVDYPSSFPIHKLAMRVARAAHDDRWAFFSTIEPAQESLIELGEAVGLPWPDCCKTPNDPACQRYPDPANCTNLCNNPNGDKCCGMCGNGCNCWKWVCKSCCGTAGCEEHDTHCRNCSATNLWDCVQCACFDFGAPRQNCGPCKAGDGKCNCGGKKAKPVPRKAKRVGGAGEVAVEGVARSTSIVCVDACAVGEDCVDDADQCGTTCQECAEGDTDPACGTCEGGGL